MVLDTQRDVREKDISMFKKKMVYVPPAELILYVSCSKNIFLFVE